MEQHCPPPDVGSTAGLGLAERLLRHGQTVGGHLLLMREAVAELERLSRVTKAANDQAEHFERLWYLAKEDAERYAFAKTLEGQVVTMETLKVRGAAELDQALDDAMAEEGAA